MINTDKSLANEFRMGELEIIPLDEALTPYFINQWRLLLEKSDNPLTLFQSPEWIESLLRGSKNRESIIISTKNNAGEVIGVVPIHLGEKKIKFDVKAKVLFSIHLNMIDVAGSIPLLPPSGAYYDLLFPLIINRYSKADGIYFDSVPVHSYLWGYLHSSELIKKHFIFHVPEGIRSHFGLTFDGSFDNYMACFSKNMRKQLKKRLSFFNNRFNDNFEFIRICTAEQVEKFLEMASSVSKKSWQHKTLGTRIELSESNIKRLKYLADKKILRAYLLSADGLPCAFRLGYQYGEIYLGAEIGYDLDFKEYSPGKVLTLKMIEDFSLVNPPKFVDFGIGYAQWKRDLCNVQSEDASIYLMRKTFSNKILAHSQSIFYNLIQIMKESLKKWQSMHKRMGDA